MTQAETLRVFYCVLGGLTEAEIELRFNLPKGGVKKALRSFGKRHPPLTSRQEALAARHGLSRCLIPALRETDPDTVTGYVSARSKAKATKQPWKMSLREWYGATDKLYNQHPGKKLVFRLKVPSRGWTAKNLTCIVFE